MNNLEREVLDIAAQQLEQNTNYLVLLSVLVEIGWTKVILNPMTHEHGCAIDDWAEQYVKGQFKNIGLVWVFEDKKDAEWFILRWS